jgi:adenosylhomocysteine nucleosidase
MKLKILVITALESELDKRKLPADVDWAYCGVGKINAALITLKAIQDFQPTLVVNYGTVGKINPQLSGMIEIAQVVQRDMLTEPLSPRGQTPFCTRPQTYHSDRGSYVCGTGDSFVTAPDPWLLAHNIDVVDMELFAIAAAAYAYKVPWQAYKYITDDANESSADDWSQKVHHGEALFLERLQTTLLELGA